MVIHMYMSLKSSLIAYYMKNFKEEWYNLYINLIVVMVLRLKDRNKR